VEAVALAVPEGELMIAGIYVGVTPTKQRERLAESLK